MAILITSKSTMAGNSHYTQTYEVYGSISFVCLYVYIYTFIYLSVPTRVKVFALLC